MVGAGWHLINNKWYYFGGSGAMYSNRWIGNYYVGGNGEMLTNTWVGSYWVGADGKWIPNYDPDVNANWVKSGNTWYYQRPDGSKLTNSWKRINGSWYYFFVNGVRVANRSIDGNYLGPNGKRVAEKQIESRHKIFCGDSRTMQLKKAVGSSETSYVYKYGRGYNWFVNEGILELKKLLLVYPQSDVILNFGVNDLGNISKYIQIYQELINTYPKAHFYVMAVNPVDDVKYPSLVQRNKTTKLVTIFNSLLKSAFPDCYIDTYSYLESSGYETLDGCHYTTATCLKIYHYTLSEIQKKSGNS